MGSAALDVYVRSFLARCVAMRSPGQAMIEAPDIHGLPPGSRDRQTRLLVTGDRARDLLPALVRDACAGMVTVCAAAEKCAAVLATDPAWRAGIATAMICRDLATVPAAVLPRGLTLWPARRLSGDTRRGVPLAQAVAAASRADPRVSDPWVLADHLRSLPRAFSLWAAVDDEGVVRATSGWAVFETTASVIFVNTDPDCRRRGIARAMTATALHAAEQAGARDAGLDASDAGRELYLQLGFEIATLVKRFRRSP